jgi:AraC-like DNA-binding protein
LRGEEEVVYAWRTADDSSLLWMKGTTPSYAVDPLGEYVIGVAERGHYTLHRGTSSYPVGQGDLVVLDPSARHTGSTTPGHVWQGRLVVVELARVRHELAGIAGATVDLDMPEPVVRAPRLRARFLELHRATERRASPFEIESALHELVAEIAEASPVARRRNPPPRRAPDIRPALERLHDDVAAPVTLDELAALVGISRYALVRRFKAEVGQPPHSYHIALRVQRARRLIERGAMPVDAALAAGFTDQSHLTRHFRRLGMTPAAYARSVAGPRRR